MTVIELEFLMESFLNVNLSQLDKLTLQEQPLHKSRGLLSFLTTRFLKKAG